MVKSDVSSMSSMVTWCFQDWCFLFLFWPEDVFTDYETADLQGLWDEFRNTLNLHGEDQARDNGKAYPCEQITPAKMPASSCCYWFKQQQREAIKEKAAAMIASGHATGGL